MNPLFVYFKQIQELVKATIATFIEENGARYDRSRSAKVFFSSFLFPILIF